MHSANGVLMLEEEIPQWGYYYCQFKSPRVFCRQQQSLPGICTLSLFVVIVSHFGLRFYLLTKCSNEAFFYLRTQAWRAGRALQRVFFFFGISHSPRTPLGHAHRWTICKHYVDKLQRFSPNCHNIFILTIPTALGRRSGAVYGEKSPKTSLVCIYCYGNTLYIVNVTTCEAMLAWLIG